MVKNDNSWLKAKSEVEVEEESSSEEETDSEEETESEAEPEEDDTDKYFERLFEARLKTIKEQVDMFATRFVFELKEDGIKSLEETAADFESLCEENIKGSKELPVESSAYSKFASSNKVTFKNDEERDSYYGALQILENISLFQYLMLHHREMILKDYCKRWDKKEEDLDETKWGSYLLEEFFMPPQGREKDLDVALVKFSEMMTKRTVKLNGYIKKMRKKDPGSVGYNVIDREREKFLHASEKEIQMSEIYFSAAIQKLKVQQEQELIKVRKAIF